MTDVMKMVNDVNEFVRKETINKVMTTIYNEVDLTIEQMNQLNEIAERLTDEKG